MIQYNLILKSWRFSIFEASLLEFECMEVVAMSCLVGEKPDICRLKFFFPAAVVEVEGDVNYTHRPQIATKSKDKSI